MAQMPIRVLPPEVAGRIAAGEVVERPVSVVKELVENALDAGATRVAVDVEGGGLSLLRVSDNGRGIAAEEIELAFHRHATSKLATGDLSRIETLGFRGEALPSIAAVAEVEAVSRTRDSPVGARLRVAYGEVTGQGAAGAAPGTSISVRGLFRRHPARLKFLRSAAAEGSQVASLVTHYALAYPEVAFSLRLDGKDVFATSGQGDRREAAAGVYGPAVAASLIEVEEEGGGRRLRALASPPAVSRSNRSYITVFINRRWVRSRSLTYAVEEAYRGLLPVGRFPIAVIDIVLPAEEVDVNVHPAKAEVRLSEEGAVFVLVQRPLRRALAGLAPAPLALETWPRTSGGSAPAADDASLSPEAPRPPTAQPAIDAGAAPVERLPFLRPLGQAGTTYVIAEGPAGLYLIDQHAAHERVLFEEVRRQRIERTLAVQALLAPVAVELTPSQSALLAVFGPALAEHGFLVEAFGPAGGHILRAAPAHLRAGDYPVRAFRELLDLLAREDGPADPLERLASSLACHAAVRAGQAMSLEEMRALLRRMEECELPQTCPHGRPTMLHLSGEELARRFGRR
jgi:DNA mismatch repair protein MutL